MDSTPPEDTGDTASDPDPDAPSATPRRRGGARWAVTGLVVVLVLAGIGGLAYVVWEYFGTDVVSRQAQTELREEIREQWKHPTVIDVLGPAGVPALGTANALVRIPRFGLAYEMPMVEGVRDGDLAKGLGHFPGAGPGQIGNFALSGARVTHGEPLRDVAKLRPGDEVIVETSDATYTYVMDTNPNDLVVSFAETWVIDPVPKAPAGQAPPGMPKLKSELPRKPLLTLTTCSELFHTDDRMVAFGHLASTTPK